VRTPHISDLKPCIFISLDKSLVVARAARNRSELVVRLRVLVGPHMRKPENAVQLCENVVAIAWRRITGFRIERTHGLAPTSLNMTFPVISSAHHERDEDARSISSHCARTRSVMGS